MILYWIVALLKCLCSFDISWLQLSILFLSSIIFIIKRNDKLAQQLLLAYITSPIYIFPPSIWVYLPITALLLAWSIWIEKRTEIGYLPYNHTNVCLAFYKGQNRSYSSNLMGLIGLNFTSVGLLFNNKLFRYRHGSIIETSHNINEYVMYDTGIKPNDKLNKILNNMIKINYNKSLFRSNCVDILMPLLIELDVEPKNYIQTFPSIYIRSLLKNVR